MDEATQVVLDERARNRFVEEDDDDAEEGEPKLERGTRSPQPSRSDCEVAAQAKESPTVGRSENLRDGESPTVARAKDRKLEAKEVDENEDSKMRDENEPPPPPEPRGSRSRQRRDEN